VARSCGVRAGRGRLTGSDGGALAGMSVSTIMHKYVTEATGDRDIAPEFAKVEVCVTFSSRGHGVAFDGERAGWGAFRRVGATPASPFPLRLRAA